MNAIFFGLKRAFHGTPRITRAPLARLGLTAARFDLLFALPHERRRVECRTMRQSALRIRKLVYFVRDRARARRPSEEY